MPLTYVLISSTVLSTATSTVTFSSIPSTYTDLVVKISARGSRAAVVDNIVVRYNADSSAIYSSTFMTGAGSTTGSFTSSGDTSFPYNTSNGNTTTANTFGSTEIYIPNYLSTISKPISTISLSETDSATDNFLRALANLFRNTSAITSMTFTPEIGPNWLTGSSFYLYGIKNS
jgi:hypothetical protein